MKVFAKIAKVLAYIWIGVLVLGMFGKLYGFVHREGFWSGFISWRDWLDPFNPATLFVHTIEFSPAILLVWIAGKLEARANRGARLAPPN